MTNKLKKVLVAVFALCFALVGGAFIGKYLQTQNKPDTTIKTEKTSKDFTWGTTVRPYALTDKTHPYQSSDLEQQFKYVRDLFGQNGCVRANIENDTKVNDDLVNYKEKYEMCLYLILEEIKDFNLDINYEQQADQLAQKIVAKYKGKIEYYQLANELSGVMVDLSGNNTETMDAGYGLSIDKNRYENVLHYTRRLSQEIRRLDPDAKIVITGHWILINPILQLIRDGVDADIVGWNWGSGMSDNPGIMEVDGYGLVDIPQIVKDTGKKFWIVEANYDDGSTGEKEQEQASYIKTIAERASFSPNISGYFHFILTDTRETGPGSNLGLVKLNKLSNGSDSFRSTKPAYNVLKSVAAKSQ